MHSKAAHASPSRLGGSVPLRVPQTPLPPKRREVRGPAYDMAAWSGNQTSTSDLPDALRVDVRLGVVFELQQQRPTSCYL